MPDFQDYPVTMVHPHFQPSKPIPIPGTQTYDAAGQITGQAYRGTPELLPPVTAANADEEERLMADGYQRGGSVDPAAWARAHADPPPPNYRPAQYPKWVMIDGVSTLVMTAQEDPRATEEDLAPPLEADVAAQPTPVAAPTELENMRLQMAAMQEQMQKMAEMTQSALAENARLSAEKEQAEVAALTTKRPPGRPRKTPVPEQASA